MTATSFPRLGLTSGIALALALPVAMAVGLAAVGAFGSYVAMPFPVRLAHFVATSLCIGVAATALSLVLRRYVFANALPLWAAILIAVVTAPFGGMVVLQSLSVLAPHALRHVSFAEMTTQVFAINLLITGAIRLLSPRVVSPPVVAADVSPARPIDRSGEVRGKLPHALRQAAIVALSAEDHYLRVRTDRGQALILMDLTGAIAALGPDAGVRVHRSHWVAQPYLANVDRDGIRIGDDLVLPVSRTGRKLLKGLRTAAPTDHRVGTGFSPR